MLNLKETEIQFLQDKLDGMNIAGFSISSFNAYRENPFIWYLRYVAKHRSRWPMIGGIRNDAVKFAITRSIVVPEEPLEKLASYALELYHAKIISQLLSVYELTTPGFSADDIVAMMRDFTKELFPKTLKSLVDTQFTLNFGLDANGEPLPAYLIPDSKEYESYLKKVQKQYALIDICVPESIKYFRSVMEDEYGFRGRVKYSGFDLPRAVIEYTDLQFASCGYSIYIGDSIPKNLDDPKTEDHQLKAAFCSMATNKPWKLVYLSTKKAADIKKEKIFALFNEGLMPKQIEAVYKDDLGKGTTVKTVEKILAEVCEKDYVWQKPIAVYDLPPEKMPELNFKNEFSGKAITRMIAACRTEYMEQDLKEFCLGNFNHRYLDQDQKAAIRKIFGFDIKVEPEEQDKEEAES